MSQEIYYIFCVVISGAGLGIAIWGARFAKKQIEQARENRKVQLEIEAKDREQARRYKAVEMVMHYSKNISLEIKFAEKIVKDLSNEECRNLYSFIPFSVKENALKMICVICPHKNNCNKACETTPGNYEINGEILYSLRMYVINYLNTMESVLLAWYLGIVDEETIEEQFAFLNRQSKNDRTLKVFRGFAGSGEAYPAIEAFYQHLDEKGKKPPKRPL